ncbi:hypothetical protein NC653_014247 [Populus alba x Populus x berolinensis]|uniref:Uncharacterized protein n=1 Tax=Populus alba x Populus x berolinensis TaxID=444605 RepID=A0AAD6QWQ8_9ROSI|nr:hypothetical protein NC653_014247 [Populus alba x Populus x berolinensis]
MMIDKLGMKWNVIPILTPKDCKVMIDGESEHYHHRGEYGSNSDRSFSSDFQAFSNQLRGFKSNSMNYENRCRLNYYYYHEKVSDNNNNNKRVHYREVTNQPRDSLIESGLMMVKIGLLLQT